MTQEGQHLLDMKKMLVTSLNLLGFDVQAMEAVNKIQFNENMFDLPNKRGAEVVLHFLFSRLNPVMCKEEFRDCWPITDRKLEQNFRKTCCNWLTNISKEEPDSNMPRISASLFLSPCGEKFYQLLFYFSCHVLQKVMENEHGNKSKEQLKHPTLTSQNHHLGDQADKVIQCAMMRLVRKNFEQAQETLMINSVWKDYVNEVVKEYRSLTKDIRDTEYEIRGEGQRAAEKGLIRGSPMVKRHKSNQIEYDFDPRSLKRAQRVQQVRDMWKQFEDFNTSKKAEREVIESIVEKTLSKHKIDSADINIKVPDMLLRECEAEIRRRHVDNTYLGGQLNLLSVLQLWNLCLHLYIEKIQQVGIPSFDDGIHNVTTQVHAQQAYLTNAQTLRKQLADGIPNLKSSIEMLRAKLDERENVDHATPRSIRLTSVGLGLMEPSPTMSFTPVSGQLTPPGIGLQKTPEEVSTPLAAQHISEDVSATVRKRASALFNTDNCRLHLEDKKIARSTISKLPQSIKKSDRQKGAIQKQSTPVKSVKSIDFNPEAAVCKPYLQKSHSQSDAGSSSLQSSSRSNTPVEEKSMASGRKTPTDYIVEEIMGEAEIISPVKSGAEAFLSRDMISRTPELEEEDLEVQFRKPVTETSQRSSKKDSPLSKSSSERNTPRSQKSSVSQQLSINGLSPREQLLESPRSSTKDTQQYWRIQELKENKDIGLDSPRSNGRSPRSTRSNGSSHGSAAEIATSNVLQHDGMVSHLSWPEKPQINSTRTDANSGTEDNLQSNGISNQSKLSNSSRSSSLNSDMASSSRQERDEDQDSIHTPTSHVDKKKPTIYSEESSNSSFVSQQKSLSSPLTEEIRRMYQEVISNTSPQFSQISKKDAAYTSITLGDEEFTPNGEKLFTQQVELEELVIGEDVRRKSAEYFPEKGFLPMHVDRLHKKAAEKGKDVSLVEEANIHRYADKEKTQEELEWEMGERLEDIEMPNVDLNDSLDDFFQTLTPDSRRAPLGMDNEGQVNVKIHPGESLSSGEPLSFPQESPDDWNTVILAPNTEGMYNTPLPVGVTAETPQEVRQYIEQLGFSPTFPFKSVKAETAKLRQEFEELLNTSRELIRQTKVDISGGEEDLEMEDLERSSKYSSFDTSAVKNKKVLKNPVIQTVGSNSDGKKVQKVKSDSSLSPRNISTSSKVPGKTKLFAGSQNRMAAGEPANSLMDIPSQLGVDENVVDNDDEADLLASLNDSFAPLKQGFHVEGGTPKMKDKSDTSRMESDGLMDLDEIRLKFQKLQEATSKVRQDLNL
ncbi:hypothetical protein CHS0354_029279 [Potamilus streckersoni]|uniref:HAUS augmin-like complex subunit 6 N-terminal domain-containing protein n=1 Tax=Potamilus streckersoni TaxID=2493646 RepID=A0AAE0T041_9BIVA|nr:hypothetical protein CHS0354_029279 [Potamilus streckersoni]